MRNGTLIALAAMLAAVFARPAGADAAADWQALARAQKQAAADPAGAIATLYALFKERPEMDPWPAAAAVSGIVRLQKATGQEETAYQLCDWALGKYGWHPAAARTVADKAILLNADRRYAEVEALVAQHWPKVEETHWSHANAVVAQWCAALQAQRKDAEQARALKKALLEVPGLLDEGQQYPPGWIYNRVAHTLGSGQEREEALRWARVRFLTCAFEPAALERSARALARVWKAVDPEGKGVAAFASAQAPPAPRTRGEQVPAPPAPRTRGEQVPAPPASRTRGEQVGNPLDAILPVGFDPALRKAQLARIQGAAQAVHDRISIHLLADAPGDALSEALSLLRTAPDLPAGTREVCRVLKAMDGNLRRANAFLAFAKSGAGANPLPALAAEAGAAEAPPPGPAARTALANVSPPAQDLVAAAIQRPGAETPAPAADTGFTNTMAHLAEIQAAVVGVLPAGPAPALARVNVSAAPMPGLDAIAVPTLPAAVAPASVAAMAAPPNAGSQAPTAPAAVPAGVAVVVPAAPPGAAAGAVGIQKVGSQTPTGTTPAPAPGPIAVDVPVPPELWPVAASPTDVIGQGPIGAAPERVGIAITVPAALPEPARVPESQPRPALSVAPVIDPAANAARPAAVLVPAAPAAASVAAAQANTALTATSPTGLPDRVAPAAAPVRQEMPGVAVAGVGSPRRPGAGTPGTVAVAAAPPSTPAGVPAPVPRASAGAPAVPAGAAPDTGKAGMGAVAVVGLAATAARAGAAATQAGVAAGTVESTIALERIAADLTSAEDVWAEGQLTGEDLIRFLDGAPLKWEDATCTAIAGLLARRGGERIADIGTLSARARIWLGVYYRLAKDSRCIALYESVLAMEGLPGHTTEVALCGLAYYLTDAGELARAAEVWLREERLSAEPSSIALGFLGAARLYSRMGNERKADDLYARISQYGYGWATGMALYDRARLLIAKRRYAEARALLDAPVAGRYADQIRVPMMVAAATASYREGDMVGTKRYSQAALAQYRALPSPLVGEGIEGVLDEAEDCLRYAEGWLTAPLQVHPSALYVSLGPPTRQQPLTFTVKTFRHVPLVVATEHGRVRVAEGQSWQRRTHAMFCSTTMAVSLVGASVGGDADDTLVVTSPAHSGFTAILPVHIRAYRPVRATPETVFWGAVAAGADLRQVVHLASNIPFRIVGTDVDAPWVEARAMGAPNSGRDCDIEVVFHLPRTPARFLEGKVSVNIDTADGRSVLCIGYSGATR